MRAAAEYLSVEEEINQLLDERASLYSSVEAHERYIAPYLGACIKDDRRHLVWQKAGEATLQTYLVGGDRESWRVRWASTIPSMRHAVCCTTC